MLTSLIRTVVLLLAVICSLRLMGKRQIGQLQPSELMITILLSQIVAIPMQDNNIPLVNTLLVIAVLTGFEILLSDLSLKKKRIRTLLDGSPVMIVKDGRLLQPALKKIRYTIDDVLEALREKDVFDLSTVAYAVVETNGNISVMLKPEAQPVPVSYVDQHPKGGGFPYVLISDGALIEEGLREAGLSAAKLNGMLKSENVRQQDVFLLTCDSAGKTTLIKKEGGR